MTRARSAGLDLLRTLAIVLVLALHAGLCVSGVPSPVRAFMDRGWAGVDLFFVLSGFLIAGQALADDRPGWRASLREFWTRRWFRTLPLYFTLLFVYVALKPALGGSFQGGDLWRFPLFLQNYSPLRDFVQSWSLCIEEQFYLVFPLLVFVVGFRRLPAFAWAAPLAISLALRISLLGPGIRGAGLARLPASDESSLDFLVRFPTHMHLDGLAMGVFLAASARTWRRWPHWLRTVIGIAGAVTATLTLWADGHPAYSGTYSPYTYSLLALGFGAMLIGLADLRLPRVPAALLERLALWSYGAYLWNNLVMRAIDRARPEWPWWLACAAFVGATFALAALTYYLVEKPFLRLRHRLLARGANTLRNSAAT